MIILDHPLISDRVSRLRDKHCGSQEFRSLLHNISALMVPQITTNLETVSSPVETPLESTEGRALSHPIILVPILAPVAEDSREPVQFAVIFLVGRG